MRASASGDDLSMNFRGRCARYRLFAHEGFPGNPTTLVEMDTLESDADLLAHSRSLPTIDNAYYVRGDFEREWRVRFFSHSAEVLLCGHALLALAHHLEAREGRGDLVLATPRLRHEARRRRSGPGAENGQRGQGGQSRQSGQSGQNGGSDQSGELEVSLPAHQGREVEDKLLRARLEAASLKVERLALFPHRVWVAACADADGIAAFDRVAFDWDALALLGPGALILSARTGAREYVLRYFSPWHGKPEDSATGSAQSYLAPLWLRDGEEASVRQLSPAGSARMRVRLEGAHVWLGGRVDRDEIPTSEQGLCPMDPGPGQDAE